MQELDEYGDEFEDEEPEVDDDTTADFAAGEPESEEEDELVDEFDTPPPETNRRRRAPLRVRLSRRNAPRQSRSGDRDSESASEDEPEVAPQPMTARQLARANRAKGILVDEPSDAPASDDTPQAADTDLALRRSELARRRRNQSEKKLEDDKIEVRVRVLTDHQPLAQEAGRTFPRESALRGRRGRAQGAAAPI